MNRSIHRVIPLTWALIVGLCGATVQAADTLVSLDPASTVTALPLTADSTTAVAQPAAPIAATGSDNASAMPAGSSVDAALPLAVDSATAIAQPAAPIAASSSDITPVTPAGSNMDTALPATADSAIAVAQPAEPIAATSSAIAPAMPVGSNMVAALPLTVENTTAEVQPMAPIGATSSILAPAMPVGSTMVTAMPMVARGTMAVAPSTADGTSSSVLAPAAAAIPSGSTIAAGDFLISNLGVVSTNAVIPETSIDARFKYSLTDISQLPKLGNGEVVALTQGTSSVTNGRMSYTIPIRLPPTANDLKPELALSYSSQNNSNGLMGVGWSLSAGGAISRCAKTFATEGALAQVPNPKLTNSDRLCYNGKKMVLRNGLTDDASYWAANAEYVTESESFTLVQRDAVNNVFKAYDKKGLIYQFGSAVGSANNASRTRPGSSTVSVWAVASVSDRYNNSYTFTYNSTSASEMLLQSIDMATARVEFTYKDRTLITGITSNETLNNSPYSSTSLGWNLLSGVAVFAKQPAKTATSSYDVLYKTSPSTFRDLVDTITECGYDEAGTTKTCAKPLTFAWSAGAVGFASTETPINWCPDATTTSGSAPSFGKSAAFQDINQDGYNDIVNGSYISYFDPAGGCFGKFAVLPNVQVGLGTYPMIKMQAGYRSLNAKGVVGDFNNDGRDDYCSGYSVYIQNPSGTGFLPPFDTDPTKQRSSGVLNCDPTANDLEPIAVDYDNDGLNDISKVEHWEGRTDLNTGAWIPQPAQSFEKVFSLAGMPTTLPKWVGSYDVPQSIVDTVNHSSSWLSSSLRLYADLNGDGYKDKVIPSSAAFNVAVFLNQPAASGFDTGINSGLGNVGVTSVYDFNKDGLLDVFNSAYIRPDGSNVPALTKNVLLSRILSEDLTLQDTSLSRYGLSTTAITAALQAVGQISTIPNYNLSPVRNLFRGDMNNDGLGDIVVFDVVNSVGNTSTVGKAHVYLANPGQPDMLIGVTDGLGKQESWTYSTLTGDANNGAPLYTPGPAPQYPYAPVSRAMQVVATASASNGVGSLNTTYYNYAGGKTDTIGRGFTGFATVKASNPTTKRIVTNTYNLDWPYTGTLAKQDVTDTTGAMISRLQQTYATHSLNKRYVYNDVQIKSTYNLQATPVSVSKTVNTMDQYGTLTKQVVTQGTGLTAPDANNLSTWTLANLLRTTTSINTPVHTIGSATDGKPWLLGFIRSTSTTTCAGATGTTDCRTVTNSYTQQPNTLDAKIADAFSSSTNYSHLPIQRITTYTRQANGTVSTISSALAPTNLYYAQVAPASPAHTTTLSNFDLGMYPLSMTNAAGHISTLAYDKRFGTVKQTIDPNGLVSTATYDPFGRQTSQTAATGALAKTINFYCTNAPLYTQCPTGATFASATLVTNTDTTNVDATGNPKSLGAPLTITYYDVLQRPVRTATYNLNGTSTKSDTSYNTDGSVLNVSAPYVSGLPQAYTRYTYDNLGNVKSLTQPDGGLVSIANTQTGAFYVTTKTVTIANSASTKTQTTTTYTNALGQVDRVTDANGVNVQYTYTSAGQLATTVTNANAATKVSLFYDAAGNRTRMIDPAAGTIDYTYNGFGELRKQTWQPSTANAKSIRYDYDALSRQITRFDTPAGTTPITTTYSWVYDTLKKGLLTSQAGNGYSESYTYNAKSQVATQVFLTDGLAAKTFTYSYDTFGRPITSQYPSGLAVTRVFHSAGIAARTQNASGASLWRLGNTLDAQGNATQQWLGNGVVTQQTYNPLNGQMATIKSGLPGANAGLLSGTLQNLAYSWDSNGNLQKRSSKRVNTLGAALENLNEAYTYDNLNRVKTVTATGVDATATTRTYGYNALGNLTSDTTGTLASTLTYPATGNVYGVTSGAGKTYAYDAYGNVTTRGTETNTYDVFNKPTQLGLVKFFYGPNGEKYKQYNMTNGVTTWYFNNGLYEYTCSPVTPCTNGSETSYAGAYVYQSTWASGNGGLSEFYLLRDHLGSVDTVTNSSGKAIQQMSFDAFGKRRKSNWQVGDPTGGKSNFFVTSKGYTDHDELDNLGLIHMGGRVYDPAIGRFLSADLFVQSPYDSQSFNRYSYVRNNPLGRTDPTGYCEGYQEITKMSIGGKTVSTSFGDIVTWGCGDSNRPGDGMMPQHLPSYSPSDMARDIQNLGTDVGSITPIEGNPYLGAIEAMAEDFTGGILFGDTSSIDFLHATPDQLANMSAARQGASGKTLQAASILSMFSPKGVAKGVAKAAAELGFTKSSLQHAFKHAKDFGVEGNANTKTLSGFSSAIQSHVDAAGTKAIAGTYRGNPVTHHVDPNSGLNVIQNSSGNFLSGWKLSPAQLENVVTRGSL